VTKRKSAKLVDRLGKNIAAKRKELGLTQERLAEAVGVDTETISRFERGATVPSLATLEILAKQLRVTIASLLDEDLPTPSGEALLLSARLDALKMKDRVFLREFIDWYSSRKD
jgi:transcriptional regulator with XRE-family HTH domain